jgi:hypothetical protein
MPQRNNIHKKTPCDFLPRRFYQIYPSPISDPVMPCNGIQTLIAISFQTIRTIQTDRTYPNYWPDNQYIFPETKTLRDEPL